MLIPVALAWLVLLPLLALPHIVRRRGDAALAPGARMVLASLLHFVVAFNVVFFVQELFLVLPKALTPGLQPTLYHNNHSWTGTSPLAALFQGTGALATLVLAGCCAIALHREPRRAGARLQLGWLAYCGAFMALPQVVIGAVVPQNDVGMAMDWFGASRGIKLALAALALLAMPAISAWLARPFLALAPEAPDARARLRALWRLVALPGLLAQPMVIAFRVPREWLEVVLLPLIVVACGVPWLLALGARRGPGPRAQPSREPSLAWPATAAIGLLALFQLVLRPGIAFG